MQPNPIAESMMSPTSEIAKSTEGAADSTPGDAPIPSNEGLPIKPEKEKRHGAAKNIGEYVESGFASVAASISELAASRSSKSLASASENTILAKLEKMQTSQSTIANEQTSLLQAMLTALNRIGDTFTK
jgi:hypothetical protein